MWNFIEDKKQILLLKESSTKFNKNDIFLRLKAHTFYICYDSNNIIYCDVLKGIL